MLVEGLGEGSGCDVVEGAAGDVFVVTVELREKPL